MGHDQKYGQQYSQTFKTRPIINRAWKANRTSGPTSVANDNTTHDKNELQNYSGCTVGTEAPANAAVLLAMACTCKASLYTTSVPLTKATLSSPAAPAMKEEVW